MHNVAPSHSTIILCLVWGQWGGTLTVHCSDKRMPFLLSSIAPIFHCEGYYPPQSYPTESVARAE
jgi:hypothetical protein